MPAAALARLPRFGHHRAERHQVAARVVERLRRQFLRPFDASGCALGVVEAGRGLHQRVETAPPRPWAGMAIGRQRDIDDTGSKFSPPLPARSRALRSPGAITLHEDVGLRQQIAQLCPPLLAARSSMKVESLPRPVSMSSRGSPADAGPSTRSTSAPCAASVRPADGTGDHAREVEHADAGERTLARGPGFGRRLADLARSRAAAAAPTACPCGVRRPFVRRAHHGSDERRLARPRSRTSRRPTSTARPGSLRARARKPSTFSMPSR